MLLPAQLSTFSTWAHSSCAGPKSRTGAFHEESCVKGSPDKSSYIARRSELCLLAIRGTYYSVCQSSLFWSFPEMPTGSTLSQYLKKGVMVESQSFGRILEACDKVEEASRKSTAVFEPRMVSCGSIASINSCGSVSTSKIIQAWYHLQKLHAFAVRDMVMQLSGMHRTAIL